MFSCSKADNSRKPVSGPNFFFLSFSTEPETCKALPAALNRPGHATLQCQQCWGPTPARSIHSFPKSKALGADCQEPRIREAGPRLGDKGTNTGNKIRSHRHTAPTRTRAHYGRYARTHRRTPLHTLRARARWASSRLLDPPCHIPIFAFNSDVASQNLPSIPYRKTFSLVFNVETHS